MITLSGSIIPGVLALAAAAANASGPTPVSRATTGVSDGDALVGTWLAEVSDRDSLLQRVALNVSKAADGKLQGSVDDFSSPRKDEPVTSLSFDHGSVTMDLGNYLARGTLSDDRHSIKGSLRPTGLLMKLVMRVMGAPSEIPVTLTRIDPAELPPRPLGHDYRLDGHHIHYLEADGSPAARVVFIHGSPGGADDWNTYLTDAALRRHATLIAVDRPGFGDSDPGKVVADLREQARLLEPLLHAQLTALPTAAADGQVPTLVVGWSEGGPIAAEMAMDYPGEVQAAILEAPAIDPQYDGAQWYNHAAAFWPIGKLVAGLMGDSLIWSNREIMALEPQLRTMEPRWKSLRVPIVVIQGEADSLVDPRTADFARRVLPPSDWIIRVPGADHGVPFTRTAMAALEVELKDLTAARTGPLARLP